MTTRKREELTSVSRLPGYQTCEDSCEWRSGYRNEDTGERNSVLHGGQFVSENAPFRTRQMSIWQQRILHQTDGALGRVHGQKTMLFEDTVEKEDTAHKLYMIYTQWPKSLMWKYTGDRMRIPTPGKQIHMIQVLAAAVSLFMKRPPRNHVGIKCPIGIPERKRPVQKIEQVKTASAQVRPEFCSKSNLKNSAL